MRLTPLVLACALLPGCYSVGFEPHGALAGGIAVPVFENKTLRRGVEVSLTRHVRREVLETTPLHLTRRGAGPVLRGSVVSIKEGVLISGAQEEVLYSSVSVAVRFGVYEGGRLLIGEDTNGDGAPDEEIGLTGYAEFDVSRGQSRDTATEEALRDLAEMVVFRLAKRHDDRLEPNDTPERATRLTPGRQLALSQRNADWFRVSVTPRHALRVTRYGPDGLTLRAFGEDGAPLTGARIRDAGRLLEYFPGEAGRDVLLQVTGPDAGARYQLLVQVLPDDGREPNDVPAQATVLRLGQTVVLLQRNDDYFRVALPAGKPLRASLSPRPLVLRATDALGAPLAEVRLAEDERSLTVPALGQARTVYLRVSGDGVGRRYRLKVE